MRRDYAAALAATVLACHSQVTVPAPAAKAGGGGGATSSTGMASSASGILLSGSGGDSASTGSALPLMCSSPPPGPVGISVDGDGAHQALPEGCDGETWPSGRRVTCGEGCTDFSIAACHAAGPAHRMLLSGKYDYTLEYASPGTNNANWPYDWSGDAKVSFDQAGVDTAPGSWVTGSYTGVVGNSSARATKLTLTGTFVVCRGADGPLAP